MEARGIEPGDKVRLTGPPDGDIPRVVEGFRAIPYDLPSGCVGAYFPETNPLIPRGLRARRSDTPASKRIPITVETMVAAS